ncbi:BcsE family c-di-GMP-binding protein [Vibrio sp. 99-70-13A1]|uniref:BcsE family c-di-GMP-binding protein n=1 Tax=Vibrio sp. 99-70-13A1 TaxID=2607601 RepID=UPI0014939369|nr:BcsE family c-di-GMP-binding protein [Vibrio sp. 99-70-13A1]NOH98109.1 hypothetical protein [Vibrio sp. 99-70-13A1]
MQQLIIVNSITGISTLLQEYRELRAVVELNFSTIILNVSDTDFGKLPCYGKPIEEVASADQYYLDQPVKVDAFVLDVHRIAHIHQGNMLIVIDQDVWGEKETLGLIKFIFSKYSSCTIVTNIDSNQADTRLINNERHLLAEFFESDTRAIFSVIERLDGQVKLFNKIINLKGFEITDSRHDESCRVYMEINAIDVEKLEAQGLFFFVGIEEIVDFLTLDEKSMVILSVSNPKEIPEKVETILSLKEKHGRDIKVIVREVVPSIRYTDKDMLLKSGAQEIVEHYRPSYAVLDGIKKVERCEKPYIPYNAEELYKLYSSPLKMKGHLDRQEFIQVVDETLNTINPAGVTFALVKIKPFKSVPTYKLKNYCNLVRHGDVSTIINNEMYLFFSSLRLEELNNTLKHVFVISLEEVAAKIECFSEIYSTVNVIDHLKDDLQSPSSGWEVVHSGRPEKVNISDSFLNSSTKVATKCNWEDL